MQVVNIITCDSEVGSGTFHAAGGRYFSTVVPIPDSGSRLSGPICGDEVEGLADGVETVAIPARAEQGIVDASDPVQVVVDRCANEGAVPIVHCVVGSVSPALTAAGGSGSVTLLPSQVQDGHL